MLTKIISSYNLIMNTCSLVIKHPKAIEAKNFWPHQRVVVKPEVDQILAGVQEALRQGCQLVEAQRSEREGSMNGRTLAALPNYFDGSRSDKMTLIN